MLRAIGTPIPETGVYTYVVPADGFSLTIADTVQFLILEPAAALAAGTITMPANPADGQFAGFSSTRVITTLTLNPNAGQTIRNAAATLTAGQSVIWIYNATNQTWYRSH